MDFVPAVHGGTTLIDSESEAITSVTHLTLPPETRFVVVDTRTPRDTGAVIASWTCRSPADTMSSLLRAADTALAAQSPATLLLTNCHHAARYR